MDAPATTETPTGAPPKPTYEDIASLIEHRVLAPSLTEDDVHAACDLARRYRIAAIAIRQCDADAVVRWMEGSGVAVASAISFPHGYSTTPAKLYEARDLLRRGVKEIEAPLNTPKMLARQFQYLETELRQLADACHEAGGVLKVTFDWPLLAEDLRAIAAKIVKRVGADFAGAALADVPALKPLLRDRLKIQVAEVATLTEVQDAREAGAARVVSSATRQILDEWKAELAKQTAATE
jgi:deoxyribose-phosphate aldolase